MCGSYNTTGEEKLLSTVVAYDNTVSNYGKNY